MFFAVALLAATVARAEDALDFELSDLSLLALDAAAALSFDLAEALLVSVLLTALPDLSQHLGQRFSPAASASASVPLLAFCMSEQVA